MSCSTNLIQHQSDMNIYKICTQKKSAKVALFTHHMVTQFLCFCFYFLCAFLGVEPNRLRTFPHLFLWYFVRRETKTHTVNSWIKSEIRLKYIMPRFSELKLLLMYPNRADMSRRPNTGCPLREEGPGSSLRVTSWKLPKCQREKVMVIKRLWDFGRDSAL